MSPTKTNIMAKFKLTRKQKGDKFVYTVTDERNNVISTRTSKRDYVACTANGDFYFSRLDLIGKGNHGKEISYWSAVINNPELEYIKFVSGFVPSYRDELMAEYPKDKWIKSHSKYAKERLSLLGDIAYLSE